MSTTDRAENSVLFALRDLRRIESERVSEEAAREAERLRLEELERARRRAAEEEARRAEAERARLEAERAQLAAELAASAERQREVQAELAASAERQREVQAELAALRCAVQAMTVVGPALPAPLVAGDRSGDDAAFAEGSLARPAPSRWAAAFAVAAVVAAGLGGWLALRPPRDRGLPAPAATLSVRPSVPVAASAGASSAPPSPLAAAPPLTAAPAARPAAHGPASPARHSSPRPTVKPTLRPSILEGCNDPLCGAKESDR